MVVWAEGHSPDCKVKMAEEKKQSGILHILSNIVEATSMWPPVIAVLAMATMVFVSIMMRTFGAPLQFVNEYTGYLAAVITMITLGYILKRSSHVAITLIPNKLPVRGRAGLEIVSLLLSLAVVTMFIYTGTMLVIDSFVKNRTAWTVVETPLGWVQLIIPIGLLLLFIQIVYEIARRIRIVSTHQPPPDQHSATPTSAND